MNIALPFVHCSLDELKALLDGGTLTVYSVARPITPDRAVDRSGVLATFTLRRRRLARPSMGSKPRFSSPIPLPATMSVRRDLHAPARRMAPSSAISPPAPAIARSSSAKFPATQGAPVTLTKFKFMPEGGWPEKPEYFDTRPRSGFALPRNP